MTRRGTRSARCSTCATDMAIGRHGGRIYSVATPDKPEGLAIRGLSCGFVRVNAEPRARHRRGAEGQTGDRSRSSSKPTSVPIGPRARRSRTSCDRPAAGGWRLAAVYFFAGFWTSVSRYAARFRISPGSNFGQNGRALGHRAVHLRRVVPHGRGQARAIAALEQVGQAWRAGRPFLVTRRATLGREHRTPRPSRRPSLPT